MIEQLGAFLFALLGIVLLAKYRLPHVWEFEPVTRDPLKDEWPEPWREHRRAEEIHLVPVRALELLADPHELRHIRRVDRDRIMELRPDIWQNGIREPLLLCVDPHGRVMLKDGHHRVVACLELGIRYVPLAIDQAKAIAKRSNTTYATAMILLGLCPVKMDVR